MIGAKILKRKSDGAPLASHPAFAWIMIAWAAALFGSATFIVARVFFAAPSLPIALGLFAAVIGAGCGYLIARSVGARMPNINVPRRAQPANKPDAEDAVQGVSILSTKELGSESLDAPLDMSDEIELTQDQEHILSLEDIAEIDRPKSDIEGGDEIDDSEPLTLQAIDAAPAGSDNDLAAPKAEEAKGPEPLIAANVDDAEIIDLKERNLADLSLVQMVERFAVGLEGHRMARINDPASRAVRPSDPRIAQAIRALPIADLKPQGQTSAARSEVEETEAALREALEKLQQMSDHA